MPKGIRKEDGKQEPLKALPPYKDPNRHWIIISVAIALIVVIFLIYTQLPKTATTGPEQVPISTPWPSVATSTPTKAPLPSPTEGPLPTIVPKEIIKCGDVAKSITLQNDLMSVGTCLTVKKEGITIDCNRYKIEGKLNASSVGIFSEFPNTAIKNCYIDNYEIGIRLKNADGSSIEETTLADNIGNALIENSKRLLIRKNNVYNGSQGGLIFTGLMDSTLEGNFIDNNRKFGIQLTSSKGNTIKSNMIYRNQLGILLSASANNIIDSNNVSYNTGGIRLAEASNENTVSNNFVSNNKGLGYHSIYSISNRIENNKIVNNEYGINIYDGRSSLVNNYVCGNTIEDIECKNAQDAGGNTCFLRATTCQFNCVMPCP
ncbi:MAG: right-handed parallel beta-helix repeat-containing protein [Candidatus Micrarchaeota archaeon]